MAIIAAMILVEKLLRFDLAALVVERHRFEIAECGLALAVSSSNIVTPAAENAAERGSRDSLVADYNRLYT